MNQDFWRFIYQHARYIICVFLCDIQHCHSHYLNSHVPEFLNNWGSSGAIECYVAGQMRGFQKKSRPRWGRAGSDIRHWSVPNYDALRFTVKHCTGQWPMVVDGWNWPEEDHTLKAHCSAMQCNALDMVSHHWSLVSRCAGLYLKCNR